MFDRLRSGLKGLVTKVTKTELTNESLDPILSDFTMSLAENDVAFQVVDKICGDLKNRLIGLQVKRLDDRKSIVEDNLRQVLLEIMISEKAINLLDRIDAKKQRKEPFILLFVGINGTGKTTTVAKVADFLKKKGYTVVLAAADTYRAGSIEQLEEHGKRLGLRVIKHDYGGDPAAVAYDTVSHARAHGVNVVLIDTAGRMQTNQNLMNELSKIKRIVSPDLTILILDSLIGNDAFMQAEEFHNSIGIDANILTKADADVKGGSALSVTYVTKKPILFIGVGQTYADLEFFIPKNFVQMIMK